MDNKLKCVNIYSQRLSVAYGATSESQHGKSLKMATDECTDELVSLLGKSASPSNPCCDSNVATYCSTDKAAMGDGDAKTEHMLPTLLGTKGIMASKSHDQKSASHLSTQFTSPTDDCKVAQCIASLAEPVPSVTVLAATDEKAHGQIHSELAYPVESVEVVTNVLCAGMQRAGSIHVDGGEEAYEIGGCQATPRCSGDIHAKIAHPVILRSSTADDDLVGMHSISRIDTKGKEQCYELGGFQATPRCGDIHMSRAYQAFVRESATANTCAAMQKASAIPEASEENSHELHVHQVPSNSVDVDRRRAYPVIPKLALKTLAKDRPCAGTQSLSFCSSIGSVETTSTFAESDDEGSASGSWAPPPTPRARHPTHYHLPAEWKCVVGPF
jgi:hypothetical protein